MNIRLFEERDRVTLSELFLLTRKENWSWLDSSKWTLSDFDKNTQDEIILVAERDQQYLGFASIYRQENFLHHLFIAPQYQYQGVGSALLNAVEALSSDTTYLKCLFGNKQALSFYLKHDWKIVGSGESEEGDYVLMAKEKVVNLD